MKLIFAFAALIASTSAQFLLHSQPIALTLQPQAAVETVPLAHQAVVENSINESKLPSELIRSKDFLRNPKTADALAKDSWLTNKEMPVFHREADDISRDEVFKIFKNAGFIHK